MMLRGAALLALGAALSFGNPVIVSSLPDYSGTAFPMASAFPIDIGTIGTFIYILPPGATIYGATLTGTWGTTAYPTATAGFDMYLAGVDVGGCVPYDAGCWQDSAVIRSFTFDVPDSVFSTLASGSVGRRWFRPTKRASNSALPP